jgi:hypothetical protein
MRKVILIIAGLVLVVSGVAAVSAYEAHTINVKATVENAITVSPDEDWLVGEEDGGDGTIFPQEFFEKHYEVSLSSSFLAQKWERDVYGYITGPGRVNAVAYDIVAEEKLLNDPTPGQPYSGDETYYAWMGEFVKTGINLVDNRTDVTVKGGSPGGPPGGDGLNFADTNWNLVGPRPAGPAPAVSSIQSAILGIQPGGEVQLDSFTLYIGVDAPVFEGYYNYWSDVCPKPNGLDAPTWEIPALDPRHNNGMGTDFGLDIKIQVTDIYFEQPV